MCACIWAGICAGEILDDKTGILNSAPFVGVEVRKNESSRVFLARVAVRTSAQACGPTRVAVYYRCLTSTGNKFPIALIATRGFGAFGICFLHS